MAQIGMDIEFAAELILQGELVAIPTETVYGLAANALNENAILKIFEAKQRPFFDPLIVHFPNIESISTYAHFHDERLRILAEHFFPGPLTLLLPKKNSIPDIVTSGLPQVAVRVPRNKLCFQLLEKINVPLAAPSANPFGYVSPTNAQHVNKNLGEKIKYILDGGECEVGLESTIVGVEENEICVYRLGGTSVEEIENCIGKVSLRLNVSSNPKSPGQLKNHYAPRKPLLVGDLEELTKKYASQKKAIIHFGEEKMLKQVQHDSITKFIPEKLNKIQSSDLCFNLSQTKNLNEAAINLFKFLRLCDESDAEIVLCEFVPDKGLGRAINDRLRRAAVAD